MTSGFGHGLAITPLHLAAAYAALVNGGIWRPATLLRVAPGQPGFGPPGLFSAQTSYRIRQLLRLDRPCSGTGRQRQRAGLPGRRQDRHRRKGVGRAAIIAI